MTNSRFVASVATDVAITKCEARADFPDVTKFIRILRERNTRDQLYMSKSFAISSNGGSPAGARADFRASIRSLNAAIVQVLPNVSWRVKRGPSALSFFAAVGADIHVLVAHEALFCK